MNAINFKRAWRMLRQDPLFSALYILGTAITLAFTTVYAVFFYISIAPVYPEYNRSATMYLKQIGVRDTLDHYWGGGLSYDAVRNHIKTMETPKVISAVLSRWEPQKVTDSKGKYVDINLKPTDTGFFSIYDFTFLQGRPFNSNEFENRQHVAVVNEALAETLFGHDTDNVIGREFQINKVAYRIVGLLKAGSSIHTDSYADAYIPYTAVSNYDRPGRNSGWNGAYSAIMLSDDAEATKAEMAEIARRYNTSQNLYTLHVEDMPQTHSAAVLKSDSSSDVLASIIPPIIILMLVPALNLSRMISGRLEFRAPELGIYRAFGATHGEMLRDVLSENLYLTLIGGMAGLILTWFILIFSADWLFGSVLESYSTSLSGANFTADMLFSPAVFLIVFVLCFILNIFSALIPAWHSLRRPIVELLKH